jgi:periplasmic divalent cation tolerance protein
MQPPTALTPRPPEMSHTDAMVVMTTVASADEAVSLIKTLLERRLIACGQIVPGVRSLYRWNGKIADEAEVIVYLKTRAARIDSLEVAFAELHPYKVPELLALPVTAGLSRYLSWITAETSLALA